MNDAITDLVHKFDTYRQINPRKRMFPKELWQEAFSLAGKLGISVVAKPLKIPTTALKKKMGLFSQSKAPTFIELGPVSNKCVAEVTTRDGLTLRVY